MSGSIGWNSLTTSSWLLRLTNVTLPPWVILVTYFPVRWDLLLLTGLGTLVLTLEPTLDMDLLIPVPILTTLTPSSTNDSCAGCSSWCCCLFVVLCSPVVTVSLPVVARLVPAGPGTPGPLASVTVPGPCSFLVLGGSTGGGVRGTAFRDFTLEEECLVSSLGCLLMGLPLVPETIQMS